ncbi:DUF3068 domain-containing protein [Actinoplanes aureus]|uniref:DUF3068 domain-containing protein n=1 Tax=Actinoplanes aureus TaxID=2792083 RepID=A0A931CHJ8_9ACTN|nr:DUF3068 domain-containing protein [Actinoplanes aureus]MBG0565060.1 DUF3068 domain-containing protein [Actinoplanes aureus]
MKRRITGATLFGLGILCVLLAGALAWIIVPSQRKVPLDLIPPDVVLEASNATFAQVQLGPDGAPQLTVENAGLRATTGIKPDFEAAADLTGDLEGNTVIWNVFNATDRADTGAAVNRSESRIALDRESGEAVTWPGQCHNEAPQDPSQNTACTPGNVDFEGQLYLFPFGTQKQTYLYWDSALHEALPMEYQAEEEYNGLPTYRFEQQIPQQIINLEPQELSALLGFLTPGSTTGSVTYQATRTIWVEPETGAIVGYRELQHRELVPVVGTPVVIFDADLGYNQATLDVVGEKAADGRSQLRLLGTYVPIGLVVLGLLLAVLGYLIARRGRRPYYQAPARTAEPETTRAQA